MVAQVDRVTGQVAQLFWWSISPEHRRRSASNSLGFRGDELWVSSPLAGGVLRIDTLTGATSLIALDEAPGTLTAVGDTIWVVGSHPDDDDEPERLDFVPTRPVVWAEGTDASARGEVFDDFSFHLPPRPAWRIDGSVATRVDLGGDVSQLTPLHGDEFLAVLRRSDDPVVMTPEREGGISFGYPGAVVRGDGRTEPRVLVELPDTSGSLIADGNSWWLVGFGFEAPAAHPAQSGLFGPSDPVALFELDIETGGLDPSSCTLEVEAILGGIGVVFEREHASRFGGKTTRCDALCFELDQPGAAWRVEMATDVDRFSTSMATDDGRLWLVGQEADAIMWLDPAAGTAGALTIDADLAANKPTPVRPEAVDLESFERSQLEGLRDVFLADESRGSEDEPSFINGITFESVELRDQFPDTHVVACFRADNRPGILFARRWNLYDELGNTQDHEYAEIHLAESIEAAGWGLPPVEECRPDSEGIVWF